MKLTTLETESLKRILTRELTMIGGDREFANRLLKRIERSTDATGHPWIDRVASLIREGHTLTTSTAFTVHGITALPSVIARLKAKGWRITIRRVGTVNSVGDNVTVCEYFLTPERKAREWAT